QYRESWPDCGCDACDEFVPALLDELETMVFAIVEGTMSEWRTGPNGNVPWSAHAKFEGLTEMSVWTDGEPEPRKLPTTPHRWGPWPIRTG
ncbi:MAG: DUF6226 family protein, partial [Aeromicrobium sp.]